MSLCTHAFVCACVRLRLRPSSLALLTKKERAKERRIIRIEQENQQIKKEKKRVDAENNGLCSWVVIVVFVVFIVSVVFPLLLIQLSPRAFHYVDEAEALERWGLVGLEPWRGRDGRTDIRSEKREIDRKTDFGPIPVVPITGLTDVRFAQIDRSVRLSFCLYFCVCLSVCLSLSLSLSLFLSLSLSLICS